MAIDPLPYCMLLIQESTPLFGIDWDAPLSTDTREAELVECPPVPNPLSTADYRQLQATVHPTAQSNDFGYSLYKDTLQFVASKLA